jgi:NAD(P)-dependent dehydrogenase (short-subunit alcohol dehydrogenase family)
MTARWTEADIPSQQGRVVAVTGATSGLGLETARVLARKGAHVLLGARNQAKAEATITQIESAEPTMTGTLHPFVVDLGDLDSVQRAAEAVLDRYERLDGLVNNAGVMFTPYRLTPQGFEQQFAVNHLGHFALTGRLLPLLIATAGSRVVSVSSNGHRPGSINLDDLQSTQSYSPYRAYFQSKLANLLFTSELQRRLESAKAPTIAVAAHPGGSNTNLGHENPGGLLGTLSRLAAPLTPLLAQSAEMGALPQLRALTDPSVQGDEYYGPDGFGEFRGHPVPVGRSDRARDADLAAALWERSEKLTGITYEALAADID